MSEGEMTEEDAEEESGSSDLLSEGFTGISEWVQDSSLFNEHMKSARLYFDVHSVATQERPPPKPSSCVPEKTNGTRSCPQMKTTTLNETELQVRKNKK